MYNPIILSATLFGSIYLCSTSLILINKSHLEDKKISNKLIALNSLTFVISGSIFLFTSLKLTISY